MAQSANYVKLNNGSWGVRVQGNVTAGQSITVTKKSGETKREKIARVLWSGNGVSLCAIEHEGGSGSHGSNHERRGVCVNCGEPCNPKYRRCLDCVDGGSRAHGGMSYYDRNGNFVLGDED